MLSDLLKSHQRMEQLCILVYPTIGWGLPCIHWSSVWTVEQPTGSEGLINPHQIWTTKKVSVSLIWKKKSFEVKRCEWVIVVSNFSKSCILMRWCLFGTRPTRLGGFLYQIMLWLLIKCTFAQQELTNLLKLKFGVKYFQLETYLSLNVLNIWLTWDQPLSPWLY